MKLVWKCDFCYSVTKSDSVKMLEHEKTCSFNPINKSCYTCEHRGDDGYDYAIPTCDLNLDIIDGEEEGNCKGWHPSDLKQWRRIKLKMINEKIN